MVLLYRMTRNPDWLERARLTDWRKRRFLTRVLDRYEGLLTKEVAAVYGTVP